MIASDNLLIPRTDMEDDLAFTIAEAIYDNMEELIAENALAAKIILENSLELPIPLHPVAIRYFEERE